MKKDSRFNANVIKGVVEDKSVHLLLPLTFMNLSGWSVRKYLDFYKLPLTSLLVVVDDIALPFGQLRLKPAGGPGGHNGLKSVESHVGSTQYMRLRMGVGHPGEKMLADYVLESFNAFEQGHLKTFIDQGVEALRLMLKEDLSFVMNRINSCPSQ